MLPASTQIFSKGEAAVATASSSGPVGAFVVHEAMPRYACGSSAGFPSRSPSVQNNNVATREWGETNDDAASAEGPPMGMMDLGVPSELHDADMFMPIPGADQMIDPAAATCGGMDTLITTGALEPDLPAAADACTGAADQASGTSVQDDALLMLCGKYSAATMQLGQLRDRKLETSHAFTVAARQRVSAAQFRHICQEDLATRKEVQAVKQKAVEVRLELLANLRLADTAVQPIYVYSASWDDEHYFLFPTLALADHQRPERPGIVHSRRLQDLPHTFPAASPQNETSGNATLLPL